MILKNLNMIKIRMDKKNTLIPFLKIFTKNTIINEKTIIGNNVIK